MKEEKVPGALQVQPFKNIEGGEPKSSLVANQNRV